MASQKVCKGSVAERSKALVLGTSLLGGVGSNPTTANLLPEYNSLLSLPQHPPPKKKYLIQFILCQSSFCVPCGLRVDA